MASNWRVTATSVGRLNASLGYGTRVCVRCGRECSVNGTADRTRRHMCGDCRSVDRAMAKRLGYA